MPLAQDLLNARAELSKMLAEAADDKAFGMFDPALQKRITDTRKEVAELTKDLGKQRLADRELQKQQQQRFAEEQRQNRMRVVATGAVIGAYVKLHRSIESLRQAGMENTVEANRQQLAYTLLGREIAGVFMPATTASTNATLASARALSMLSQGGQNVAFVLATATAGLVTFSAAMLFANAAGLKFTGILAGIVKWLPLIGLGGGLLIGLGALFLQTKDGADLLNKALEKGVELLNEMSAALDTLKGKWGNGGWLDEFTTNLGIGIAKIGEDLGVLPKGIAKEVFREHKAAKVNFKPEARRQPTPANYRFEGVSDAYERVQLAAAKQSSLMEDIPKKQLDVQEKQLEELRRINAGNVMRPLPWWQRAVVNGIAEQGR